MLLAFLFGESMGESIEPVGGSQFDLSLSQQKFYPFPPDSVRRMNLASQIRLSILHYPWRRSARLTENIQIIISDMDSPGIAQEIQP